MGRLGITIMKRTIAVLTFFVIFILSACSAAEQESSEASSSIQSDVSTENAQENSYDDVITESGDIQEAEEEESSNIEISLDEMVLVDDETCLVEISGSVYITDQTISITVEWENRSEDTVYNISAEDVCVNGLRTSWYFSPAYLEPGESSVDYCYIYTSDLAENGITEYTDIALTLTVYNLYELGNIAEVSTHIYPYGEENATVFVREAQDTDQVLVENDDFAFVVIGSGAYDESGGYSIPVYLVNKTDYELRFYGYEGNTYDDTMSRTSIGNFPNLVANTSAFASIYFSESEADEYGVDSAESIALRLLVYSDAETGTIYDEMLTVLP